MVKRKWQFEVEEWPFVVPYRFAGCVWTRLELFVAKVSVGDVEAVGEGAGVYYHDEPVARMPAEAERLRGALEAGIGRDELAALLPPGGLRNAIDCALWDLEAKCSGTPAWAAAELAGLEPLICIQTISIGEADAMAREAVAAADARAIKLKVAGDGRDADRVRAVRAVRPDIWLGIDANQSLTGSALEKLMPALVEARVDLLEQPFPVGAEALLDDFQSAVPIAADESVQTSADLEALVGRVQVVNIKLDKTGGLTGALDMAREAQRLGFRPMVGNMLGTSRAMAPGMVVGQLCDVVDLDGPLLMGRDVDRGLDYSDGLVRPGACTWGMP